jgi:cytochrome c-type biogenesis protein CcmF
MLLFLGVIGSGKYSEEVNVSLPIGETKEALGYNMTYLKATPIPGEPDKYHFNVALEKDGKGFLLQPIMYYSEYSQGVMKNPDWANLFYKDIYLSPMALEVPEEFSKEDVVQFNKGEEKEVKGLKIKFVDFDRSKFDRDAMQEGKETLIGAELLVSDGKNTETVVVEQLLSEGSQQHTPVKMKNHDHYTFYLTNMSIQDESAISVAVVDESQPKNTESPEILVLTASIKPFINFVWIGTLVMGLGFFFSIVKRVRRLKGEVLPAGEISGNGHKGVHTNGNTNGHVKQKQSKQKQHN